MDTDEQVAAREDKIRFVGDVLAVAGCSTLYDHLTVAQAERLHDAIMAQDVDREVVECWTPVMREVAERAAAQRILGWCETMRHGTPATGTKHHTEGWNSALEMLGHRIAREFGCHQPNPKGVGLVPGATSVDISETLGG